MRVRLWWMIVIVFLIEQLCFFCASSNNITCHPRDLEALQGLISNLVPTPDGWTIHSSPPSDCCRWTGITCSDSSSSSSSSSSSRVSRLELPNSRLSGQLSESLARLDHLRVLNLSRNSIKNSIPLSLFNLLNLETLDLSSNEFHGAIPETMNLASLQTLDLSFNRLNGSLPAHACRNSSHLSHIRLTANSFSGDFTSGFGKCLLLQHLSLGMNNLAGTIPDDVFHLQQLSHLSLHGNNLSGTLSPAVGNLSSLVHFDISSNRFSGNLPDVFDQISDFQYLIAQSNRFTGGIPRSLSSSPTLKSLNLRNNSLSGPLHMNCDISITNLTSLNLGTNNFNGLLPENLASCRHLQNLNLARNSFHGQIPESFINFQSLSYLSLSNSSIVNISATLHILQQCKNLTTLVLTLNFRGEALPDDEQSLHFEKLKVLVVANCRLTGKMPSWLSKSSDLQLLDLSWNHLTGLIPSWIGNFSDLFYLDLSNNSFTGEIPRSLTRLPSLINKNISYDEISPDFPFFRRGNQTAGGLQYNQIIGFPPTIELGHNNLTGPIWEEFGNLKKVHVFDLRMNRLSGSIPSTLSGMTSLEVLDLSYNNLSGSIPDSLQKLSFLSTFSVAYNNLSGRIPSGSGQFQTFSSSSFEGNNLCGDHWFRCREDTPDDTSSIIKRSRTQGKAVGIGVGIAFGAVFLLVFVTLIPICIRRRAIEIDEDEKEDQESIDERELDETGSKPVILFHNDGDISLTFDDLLKSTNNFDEAEIIGCGGFGLVYKATLPDGRNVAIKRLSGDCGQIEREFRAEVETLSRARHRNLVHLRGFCFYKNDRLLIHSYMENGSLDYWLHENPEGPTSLNWRTRLKIAKGSAEGLAYLHHACEPRILHRDIKSSNILLNDRFEAHLADFGLARLIRPYETHVTTDLVGTLGYIPPEYGQASVATYKGDVYSYGVVLLELLTGKRPMDVYRPKGPRDLISWVTRMKEEDKVSEVFDAVMYCKDYEKEMLPVLDIACLCLKENPRARPTTQQLVNWLQDIHDAI